MTQRLNPKIGGDIRLKTRLKHLKRDEVNHRVDSPKIKSLILSKRE
jgi:hypothetical protein